MTTAQPCLSNLNFRPILQVHHCSTCTCSSNSSSSMAATFDSTSKPHATASGAPRHCRRPAAKRAHARCPASTKMQPSTREKLPKQRMQRKKKPWGGSRSLKMATLESSCGGCWSFDVQPKVSRAWSRGCTTAAAMVSVLVCSMAASSPNGSSSSSSSSNA